MSARVEEVESRDGTRIAVWCSGEGPPLVLVHGTSADHTRWAPVLPALEERFTVLAMDRRGRGRSGDAESYAFEREFEDVAAVVDWAGEAVDVMGHSHGAVCAVEAALLTERMRRLILYEPPLGFVKAPPETVAPLEELVAAGKRDEVLRVFFAEVVGAAPEQIDHLRSLPAWEARLRAAHTIPREERVNREYVFEPGRFRDVRVPALLLEGGESAAPFREAHRALDEALPDSRVIVMPGQGHTAMDSATELFSDEVLSFLG